MLKAFSVSFSILKKKTAWKQSVQSLLVLIVDANNPKFDRFNRTGYASGMRALPPLRSIFQRLHE
jgi:hypothetical protein